MVQTVSLTHTVLLSFVLWPALFFVVLAGATTAKVSLVVLSSVFIIIIALKEFRAMQVLWAEKIDIFSIHFFAYLFTFKFFGILQFIHSSMFLPP